MICSALKSIGLSEAALRCGASMDELNHRGDLSAFELGCVHKGKERSVEHMLAGGNGFPPVEGCSPIAQSAFDAGMTIEKRDARSYLLWSADLAQCMADRRRGATA